MRRRGRRGGRVSTRGTLLEEARRLFAERGYDGATVRAIASAAAVDPRMITHFFGSKQGLFREAVGWPFDPATAAARLVAPGPGTVGERMVVEFFRQWDDPVRRAPLEAILRSAMTQERSAALVREFVANEHLAAMQRAGVVRGAVRADLVVSCLIGVAVMRYVLRLEPLASSRRERFLAPLVPAITTLLEG